MTADGGELAALDAQGTVYMYTTAVPPGSAENGPGTAEYYMQQPPIQQLQQMTLSPTGVSSGGLHTYQAYAPPPQAGVTQVSLGSGTCHKLNTVQLLSSEPFGGHHDCLKVKVFDKIGVFCTVMTILSKVICVFHISKKIQRFGKNEV